MLGYHPPEQTPLPPEQTPPPGADTPHPLGADTPPPAQSMLGDTVNARAVRILLECKLVSCVMPVLFLHINYHHFNHPRLVQKRVAHFRA